MSSPPFQAVVPDSGERSLSRAPPCGAELARGEHQLVSAALLGGFLLSLAGPWMVFAPERALRGRRSVECCGSWRPAFRPSQRLPPDASSPRCAPASATCTLRRCCATCWCAPWQLLRFGSAGWALLLPLVTRRELDSGPAGYCATMLAICGSGRLPGDPSAAPAHAARRRPPDGGRQPDLCPHHAGAWRSCATSGCSTCLNSSPASA